MLHITSQVYVYPSGGQVPAFLEKKEYYISVLERQTRHTEAFTLLQMCCLFYLKGACVTRKLYKKLEEGVFQELIRNYLRINEKL